MIYELKREQFLHSNISDVWDFISSPKNLPKITPKYMSFNITSKELLKRALLDYDGSLIIVSHDREFLQGLTEKVYEFKERNIKEYHHQL